VIGRSQTTFIEDGQGWVKMRDSVTVTQRMQQSINDEIAVRIKLHQDRIVRLKAVEARLRPAEAQPVPLVMLAHGDSWFDYPLDGNSLSLSDTDVIAQLRTMGNINPLILNVAHHGDSSVNELSWPKQQRMIDALSDPGNWLASGKPDAILFSGGGDDIAGDQFCIYLDYASEGGKGLNPGRFREALGAVEASYRDLFGFRNKYAPDVEIFGHCYDFAIPNGSHPVCVGPWLKPSLEFAGYRNLQQNRQIVHDALTQFRERLEVLASDRANKFSIVETQGTLTDDDWANELHPGSVGFKKIAERFVGRLRGSFGGRI
jgi:hypothetical protein